MLRSSEIKPLVRQICHILWQVIFFIKALWYLWYNETLSFFYINVTWYLWYNETLSFFYRYYLVPLVQQALSFFYKCYLVPLVQQTLCRFFKNVIWYLWYSKTLSMFYRYYLILWLYLFSYFLREGACRRSRRSYQEAPNSDACFKRIQTLVIRKIHFPFLGST